VLLFASCYAAIKLCSNRTSVPADLVKTDLVCCSHFVVPELLSDYIAHRVPGQKREDFMRANEVACFAFILPQVSCACDLLSVFCMSHCYFA